MVVNAFTTQDGTPSTIKIMLGVAAALLLLGLVLNAGVIAWWLPLVLLGVGVTMLIWLAFSLYDIFAMQAIERAKARAALDPKLLIYDKMTRHLEQQARVIAETRGMTPEQVRFVSEMNAAPHDVVWDTQRIGYYWYIREMNEFIPASFVWDWMAAHRAYGNVPPVGTWNDSKKREWAGIITAYIAGRGVLLPAMGNKPASWLPTITENGRRAVFDQLGITWLLTAYQLYLQAQHASATEEA